MPRITDREALDLGLQQAYGGGDYLDLERVSERARLLPEPECPRSARRDLDGYHRCSDRYNELASALAPGELIVGVFAREARIFAAVIHNAGTLALYEADPSQGDLVAQRFYAASLDLVEDAREA